MSLSRELAKDQLLAIALQGCRAVLERELEIKSVIFSMASNVRQEMARKAQATGKELTFPYSYMTHTSLAALKDKQSNYAVQKHGVRFNMPGERAATLKGYMFPITLGLDLHYVDNDEMKTLLMAQSLALLSLNKSLSFQINVGDFYTFNVDLELPLETTINVAESNEPTLPGAIDLNASLIMTTTIGFFRSVAAVNGSMPQIEVKVKDAAPFQLEIPK